VLDFLNPCERTADAFNMAEEEEFVWAVKGEGHLITNKAGASARQQAKQLRDAEPVRTRLARLLKVHTDERAHRVGADGEEAVGARLDRLPTPPWMALHDIILNDKGTNLDHLVIGPAGVFSLNTKHHPDKKIVVTEKSFRVNGYAEKYLHVARHEAKKVSEILSAAMGRAIPVRAVIVVMGAELEVRSAPPDVDVVRRKDLPKWFLRRPVALDQAVVNELMHVAGRPSTWKQVPAVTDPELSVKPWSKRGLKRLYVNDASGEGLGYRDEVTGKVHVNDPKDLERVTRALETH
jgi:hypothetical protein